MSPQRACASTSPRQSGIALVLVLWILSLLAIIANSFVFSTRTDTQLTANLVGQARAEALADAGVQRALYALLKPSVDPARWQGDGRMHLWMYEGEAVYITIRSESARIDINTAHPDLLKGLLRNAGVDGQALEMLPDAIQDWRDADDLRRLHGAEKDDYAAAGKTYTPANSNFQTIEELRQVLGMRGPHHRIFRANRHQQQHCRTRGTARHSRCRPRHG
jgi:general secretion pathway protein K